MDRRLLRRPRSEPAPPARRMGRRLRRTAQGPGPVSPAAPSAQDRPWVSSEEWDAMQKDIWKAMATAVDESLAHLDAVPVGDNESLAACARDAAGIFAALSARYEGHHPNSFALAGAARSIGRLAQRKPPPTRRTRPPSQARAAFAQAALGASPLTSDRSEHGVWWAPWQRLFVCTGKSSPPAVCADAEKALAVLQPRPVAQRLVKVTSHPGQTCPRRPAQKGSAENPPRRERGGPGRNWPNRS